MSQTQLTERPAWKAMTEHYHKLQQTHLRQFFAEDPGRGEQQPDPEPSPLPTI